MVRHFGKFGDALDVEYREDGRVFLLLGQKAVGLPRHKAVRITLGIFIALIGLLPFLPISIVGLLILSVDVPWMGRARHALVRAVSRLVRKFRAPAATKPAPQVVLALSNRKPPK